MNLLAQAAPPAGGHQLPPITNPNIPVASYGEAEQGVEKLITLGIGVATIAGAVLLVAYFAYGALRFILSGGDAKGADAGKQAMTHAAIGLLILVLVTTIAAILGRMLGINILSPDWQSIFI